MVDSEDPSEYCRGGYHPTIPGEVFLSRYEAVRKLGWGHFSIVWLCKDLKQDKLVAVKIQKSSPDYTQAALEESDMLIHISKLSEDNSCIVKMLHSFMHRGPNGKHVCLVFELLGDSLLSLLREFSFKGLPLSICKDICKQVLLGLDCLHSTCGLIHTDVKPENILLCLSEDKENRRNISVKIADLGNACHIQHRFASTIQTRPYRAPEVILGISFNEKCDIWSLACTLFELITGKLLFKPKNINDRSKDEEHLLLMIHLIDEIPQEWAATGKFAGKFTQLFNRDRQEPRGIGRLLTDKYAFDMETATQIESFLKPMLNILPQDRPSAQQCLEHPWINNLS